MSEKQAFVMNCWEYSKFVEAGGDVFGVFRSTGLGVNIEKLRSTRDGIESTQSFDDNPIITIIFKLNIEIYLVIIFIKLFLPMFLSNFIVSLHLSIASSLGEIIRRVQFFCDAFR